jgi:hypothetical protein
MLIQLPIIEDINLDLLELHVRKPIARFSSYGNRVPHLL